MATEANPTPSTHAPVTPVLSYKKWVSVVRFFCPVVAAGDSTMSVGG